MVGWTVDLTYEEPPCTYTPRSGRAGKLQQVEEEQRCVRVEGLVPRPSRQKSTSTSRLHLHAPRRGREGDGRLRLPLPLSSAMRVVELLNLRSL